MVASKSNGEIFVKTTSGTSMNTFCSMDGYFLTLIGSLRKTSEIIGATGVPWQSLASILPLRGLEAIRTIVVIMIRRKHRNQREVLENRRPRMGPRYIVSRRRRRSHFSTPSSHRMKLGIIQSLTRWPCWRYVLIP